jgi:NADH-quinone oxidoreductase subunit M
MLTTVMGFVAIFSSWNAIRIASRNTTPCSCCLQTGMIGVFISLDFFLFYVFWELVLVPMYFIIGIWGGPRKLYAAIKFFLYTLAGGVLMLLGILTLYFQHAQQFGRYTFEISELMKLNCRWACSSGSSGPSSSASPSRCRCSRSTPGCPTRT